MKYRCATRSVTGFVQQLVSCYLPHGYWFYVVGNIPVHKDPLTVDEKLQSTYGISMSRQARARRKQAGIANLHYLRYQRYFIMLATHGLHPFFDNEKKNIRDVRRIPIRFAGYSISCRRGNYLRKTDADKPAPVDGRWRVRVQIERKRYQVLRAFFVEYATRRSAGYLARELYNLPFEPYAPVRQQLLNLVRLVNKRRKASGLVLLEPSVLRYRRNIVKPFEDDVRERELRPVEEFVPQPSSEDSEFLLLHELAFGRDKLLKP